MKTLFTVCFLFCGTFSMAQYPILQMYNASLEEWSNDEKYGFLEPANWATAVDCSDTSDCIVMMQRTTDAIDGYYALQHFSLEKAGVVHAATFSNIDLTKQPGSFNFNGRPLSVTFYYKYSTDDHQPMTVSFLLFTGSIYSPNPIASASYSFDSNQSTYQKVDAAFDYVSTATPMYLLVTSKYDTAPATALDTLTLDNFIYNYTTTAIDDSHSSEAEWKTYMSSDKTLHSSLPVHEASITDITGKAILSFTGDEDEFPLHNLKSGVYLIIGTIHQQPVTRRLLVD